MASMLGRFDRTVLADAIADVIGETDASAWALIDQGFSSAAYMVDGWVVRVARNTDAQWGHELELRLLPALAGRLAVAIPVSPLLVEPRRGIPFGALVYRWLPGRPMQRGDGERRPELAIELADTLIALHSFPLPAANGVGVPRADLLADLAIVRELTQPLLGAEFDPSLATRLDAWFHETLADPLPFVSTLCHGDPWYGNLLVDDGLHLVGLVDFEAAVVTDPAVDLAATFHMGPTFGRIAADRYHRRRGDDDRTFQTRVQRHRLLRELNGVVYVLRHDWEEELPDAISKVRSLLIE
jgi:aminoglycoside 2''-phosphotransferase